VTFFDKPSLETRLKTAIAESGDTKPLRIAVHHFSDDFKVLHDAVNQGIDSHLEAVQFTELQRDEAGRRVFDFSLGTIHVLVRRLSGLSYCTDDSDEHGTDTCHNCQLYATAEYWAIDICDTYGVDFWG
jgi:hypothetical protein